MDFEPYGDKWKREMMKWRKKDLIEFLQNTLRLKQEQQRRIEELLNGDPNCVHSYMDMPVCVHCGKFAD